MKRILTKTLCMLMCVFVVVFSFMGTQVQGSVIAAGLGISVVALGLLMVLVTMAGIEFVNLAQAEQAAGQLYWDSPLEFQQWLVATAVLSTDNTVTIVQDAYYNAVGGIQGILQYIRDHFSAKQGEEGTVTVRSATKVIVDSVGAEIQYFDVRDTPDVLVLHSDMPYGLSDVVTIETSAYVYCFYHIYEENGTGHSTFTLRCDRVDSFSGQLRSWDIYSGFGPTSYFESGKYSQRYGFFVRGTDGVDAYLGVVGGHDVLKKYSQYDASTAVSIPLVGTGVNIGFKEETIPYTVTGEFTAADVAIGGTKALEKDGAIAIDIGGIGILTRDKDGELDLDRDLDVPITQEKVIPHTNITDLTKTVPIEDDEDFDDYVLPDITRLFPFCVPFDLVALVSSLNAMGKAPRWEIPVDFSFAGYEDVIVIDLADFEVVAKALRWGMTLIFLLGLIMITRKMIQG